MAKTQTTIRIDKEDYIKAKKVLDYLGLSYSQAIGLFNRMIVLKRGLPFEAKIPNEATIKAVKESLKGINTEPTTISKLKEEFENIRKT